MGARFFGLRGACESKYLDLCVTDDLLNSEERADEFLLMGLRLAEGIDPARYTDLSGRALDPKRIAILREEGAIVVDDNFKESSIIGPIEAPPRARPSTVIPTGDPGGLVGVVGFAFDN